MAHSSSLEGHISAYWKRRKMIVYLKQSILNVSFDRMQNDSLFLKMVHAELFIAPKCERCHWVYYMVQIYSRLCASAPSLDMFVHLWKIRNLSYFSYVLEHAIHSLTSLCSYSISQWRRCHSCNISITSIGFYNMEWNSQKLAIWPVDIAIEQHTFTWVG